MGVNDKILDAEVSHQIGLIRYGNGIVNKIIALLKRTDADLYAQLIKSLERLPASASIERIDEQLKAVRRINEKAYNSVSKELDVSLSELTAYELGYQANLFDNAVPLSLAFNEPSARQVYAATMARPFQGRLLSEWVTGLEADAATKIRDAVRLGFVEGQTIPQITKRIRGSRALNYEDGILAINRRNAEAVVRTAVSHTANYARQSFYDENQDLIKGYRYTATLDGRTTALCFTGETSVISVGDIENVYRSKYRGEVVVITTSSGKQLVGTPNHPILTSNGFLPMGEINPSKHVVYSVSDKMLKVLADKDVHVQPNIASLFDSFNKPSIFNVFRKSPTATDFYGDGVGMYDKVDIIATDSKLRNSIKPSLFKTIKDKLFRLVHKASFLATKCGTYLISFTRLPIIKPAQRYIVFFKNLIQPAFASAIQGCKNSRWSSAILKHFDGNQLIPFDVYVTLTALKRWHGISFFQKICDCRCARIIFNSKFASRNAAFIFEDNIVSVSREFRDCHVYSLGNSLGFYIAGGIIVKNCASRDGKIYRLDQAKPALPAHFNCRSTYTVVLKSWRELGFNIDDVPPSTRASMDGQVPETITYQEWLKRKPAAFQDEVLGKAKGKLFREGLPLDRFVNERGKVYTLKELERIDSSLFT